MPDFDTVWTDVNLATVREGEGLYGVVESAAIGVRNGRIAWLGAAADLELPPGADVVVHSGRGRWLTAGLVDCHTHLVFGGDRADEFERLLEGERYDEIAHSGGGIRATVRSTRTSGVDSLVNSAAKRAATLLRGGVTTLEVKSGYGLDVETELKMLDAAQRVGTLLPLWVQGTLLAAHAVPEEFEGRTAAYVDYLVEVVVPAAAEQGFARQIDAFVEGIAFSRDQARRVLVAGQAEGFGVRVHADQLTESGGAALAVELGARSADHLEYTSVETLEAMAHSGVAAVLLPGAYHTLGETGRGTPSPNVDAMRKLGVPMAVATDLNPGTSPLSSMTAAMNLACTLFGVRPHEALWGATRIPSGVLGLSDRGELAVGLRADFALWDVGHPRELAYWVNGIQPDSVVVAGEVVFGTEAAPSV